MDPPTKRRKVRKGTHSCWECRRRKVRCIFRTEEDTVCNGCQERETPCLSQQFAPQQRAPAKEEPKIEDRLGKLEDLMEKIIRQTTLPLENAHSITAPSETSSHDTPQSGHAAATEKTFSSKETPATTPGSGMPRPEVEWTSITCVKPPDLLDSTAAHNAHSALGTGESPAAAAFKRNDRCSKLSQDLYDLFPSKKTIEAVYANVPEAGMVSAIVWGPGSVWTEDDDTSASGRRGSSTGEIRNNKMHPKLEYALDIPSPDSHPALLTKKLLTICFLMQQLPYEFDPRQLHSPRRHMAIVSEIAAVVIKEVTSNDDVIGCLEGLESLLLLAIILGDTGLLRKAWMTTRRALNLGQIMGIHRKNAPPLRSCDPNVNRNPALRIPSSLLWHRINYIDRYNSLILGLPIGSPIEEPSRSEERQWDTLHDTIGRLYVPIMKSISDRNDMSGLESAAPTQFIDVELESAGQQLISRCPSLNESDPSPMSAELSTLKLQIRHDTLLVLLHLPFLLQDQTGQKRFEYNRVRCLEAARSVIQRFLQFRNPIGSITSGRSVDYSALISGMTLLSCHHDNAENLTRDRERVRQVVTVMEQMVARYNDKLAADSIELLSNLMSKEGQDADYIPRPPMYVPFTEGVTSMGEICQATRLAQFQQASNNEPILHLPDAGYFQPGNLGWLGNSLSLDTWFLQDLDENWSAT